MPIDLLEFPNDLLREVFRLCDPFELYKLSKCSKKCSQKAITLRETKNWKITYWRTYEILVSVDDSNYNFNKIVNPEGYFTKRDIGSHSHIMDIEFPNGGAVDLFIYLIDIFGIRIVNWLEITISSFANFSKAAKVLVDRNMEIEKFGIGYFEEEQDVVNFMPMLNQMNITKEFQCFLIFPPDFHFQFIKYPRKIFITDSSWLNINQLLNCTCAHISLIDSMLSNQDLDLFLQNWKNAGAFPNLRVLKIGSNNIDNQSPILEMIPPITTAENPRIKVSIRNNLYDTMIDGVRVIKDDGTVGWLKVDVEDWPKLDFLIADPADTVVEEIPEEDD